MDMLGVCFITIILLQIHKETNAISTMKQVILSKSAEEELFTDLTRGSAKTEHLNFQFVGTGLNTLCTHVTCEKFTLTDLKGTLDKRGSILNTRQDPSYRHFGPIRNINAGSRRWDVIILKFSSFSQEEQDNLALIRKYNSKCHLVILTEGDKTFFLTTEYMLLNKIYDATVIRNQGGNIYNIYTFCAFCSNGNSQFLKFTYWISGYGFKKELSFESSFKGQFFGACISVGLKPSLPSYFQTGRTDEHGAPIYSGIEFFLLETLAKYLNFNFIVKVPDDGKACRDDNHMPGGFCKMLLEKRVDIAGFSFDINVNNFHYYDPTYVYYQLHNSIISAKLPLTKKWVALFDPAILLVILVSLLTLSITYWLICKYWYKENITFTSSLLIFYAVLFMENLNVVNQNKRSLVLLGTWILACLFIISLVLGDVTSLAASPGLVGEPVDTVEAMVKNNMTWVTPPFWHTDYYLSMNKQVQNIKKRKKIMPKKEGLEYILANPTHYVYYGIKRFIDPVIRSHFWNGKDRNPFHFSPPVIGDPQWMQTVLVGKDAPYRDAITMKLLQIEASGIYRFKFVSDSLDEFGKESKVHVQEQQELFTPFGWDQILVVVIMWASGLFISALTWCIEYLYWRITTYILHG